MKVIMPLIVVIIFMLMLVVVIYVLSRVFFSLFTMSLFHGPYFAGTSPDRIDSIKKLADIKTGDRVVDLGSGDGRVLIALAKEGVQATGLELNPWLVNKSQKRIKKAKLENKINIKQTNFWQHDLGQYDVIVIYGIGYIMERLEEKLKEEAKDNVKIISIYFQFPNLKPVKSDNEVHLYQL